ncbi:leucine-rich repeat domain-containing protein [Flavobacterium sp. C3NV]|uniref:leucine-rich repeat domain-containing protein n=1 Tax=Flavobacterium sp. C3NV TaxID=3393358 RepID=UPI00398FAECB
MKKILEKILNEKETIKRINLSEQYSLTKIPESIKDCLQLEVLDVSYTEITEIPDFVFQLPKLKELNYLGCEKLKNQPRSFFSNQSLKKISIYISKKQVISEEIKSLTSLKSITINGNIKEIPNLIYDLTNLEELELFDTKISTVSEKIEKLNNLKKISFWQALFLDNKSTELKLEEIFQNLSKCSNLKELNIDQNDIKEIPENISLLKQLQKFSASNNKLKSYPSSLYNLTKLTEIDLGINKLKKVEKGIGNLKSLKTLKLNSNWKNQLDAKNLFNELHQLENLEILELWSCQSITEIPETISSLKKLKKLDVDNNLLENLPKSISTMHHLKTLRISTNKISLKDVNELRAQLTTTKIIA